MLPRLLTDVLLRILELCDLNSVLALEAVRPFL